MDKDRVDAIVAVTARGEQIKTNSAEHLWICRAISPPLLPDKPVITDRSATGHPDDLQLQLQPRLLNGSRSTKEK